MTIEEKLKLLPEKPGVYIMKDKSGKIIYVGKAVVLKNRVRQYFQNKEKQLPKVKVMLSHVEDFEYIVTDTELEALMLECNLIKKYKPKYNVLLKDDKNYPYIKVTVNEEYPRIMFTRRIEPDGAKYFGPYSSAFAVRETIKLVRKMFPIRTCNKNIEKDMGKVRECLYYHIGLCSAPCTNKINKEDYIKLVDQAVLFLDGKRDWLIQKLKEDMKKAAEELRFEEAARIRDQIFAIERTSEKQKVVSVGEDEQDIISMARSADISCIQVFFVRDGKLSGREHYYMKNTEGMERGEIISSFIKQFYEGAPYIPKEIITDVELDESELLSEWLSQKRGNKVFITIPVRGKKKELVDMVYQNALEALKNDISIREEISKAQVVLELSNLVGLDYAKRIEAYDISNTRGQDNVGSMVVFVDGKPKKSQYRKFNIKYVEGQDDYESMREVIERRFLHAIEEKELIEKGELEEDKAKFAEMPDLIFVDGGIGHVNAVLQVLSGLGISIPVYGMVKDSKHRTRGLVSPQGEIDIPMTSKAFRLIAQIQEEAHRFAITFHKEKQSKRFKSELLNIPGIGEKRAKALYDAFKSIEEIKRASVEDLKKVEGMNEKAAQAVYEYFRK
ncbi:MULTISPECIES: excinuclease ABC subunit UvrC [Thermoanaerobacter]|jgi:excinuclease ABC subunit C|uniref:UvrABC system protein C n=2 Tax=Thermoanaerobacter TaxID=1754 RepID=UVRC_THEP3|nr:MULTISPECIES: excinuclease ABC subunit UvrC [Thermoanaerobacter]B0K791.1 RecName: Full=UvrABC system protein C; Short=Protein UvrC; AltName: Full=Excinuclease ABC subunit C [Thermoanaerobacter pseudethanolicus ATCC 33223]ABY94238.1 excinuclease ABC, C subunit [Thermoanaerobacter pseudethanolicus ATCC 33223]ADV79190.1 excinuclease ABC, C subunit [Thermoanaerobacter brockii subsp. finnii Ako-1]HBW59719.1 excinuclease ABC subunit C [Thermoanaerobacter sp.]HCD10438.1 excinuclease ABC subunit C 